MTDEEDADREERAGLDQWRRWADDLEAGLPRLGAFPFSGLLRTARRLADLSQRQLATSARVVQSTVAKVEAGSMTPSLDVFQRLLAAAGLSLVVIDSAGRLVLPMRDSDDTRDDGDRRYPSHLDVILDPLPGEWWADEFGLARPPETFHRNRERRDAMRRRAVWFARMARYRNAPEPPDPDAVAARAAAQARRRQEYRDGTRPVPEVELGEPDWDDVD